MSQRTLGFWVAAILLNALWLVPATAADAPPVPAPAASVPAPESSLVGQSVVKVFSTMREPDPLKPWLKQAPTRRLAAGS